MRSWGAAEIAREPILTFANNTKPNRQIRELLAPHAMGNLDMTTSTSLGALIRLAKSGLGICVVPKPAIAAELASGELVELRTKLALPPISVHRILRVGQCVQRVDGGDLR